MTTWADDAARKAIDDANAAQAGCEAVRATAERLAGRVRADGRAYFEDVSAEFRAAAATFNGRIGRAVIDVSAPASGPIVAAARIVEGAGFASVLPCLSTEDRAPVPGAIVTVRQHGRENRIPFDFMLAGEALRLRWAGEALAPDAFARHALAPWLASINIGGR